MNGSLIAMEQLVVGYRVNNQPKTIHPPLNLHLNAGEMVCLIGPNGCGKSTLLRTLAGLQPALGGSIYLDGHNSRTLSVQQQASLLSLVLTDPLDVEHMRVRDLVALGRTPYRQWIGGGTHEEQRIVDEAMEFTSIHHLADKSINRISDGERQRCLIAKALAQQTPIVLLDEPTAHLDISGRVQIMQLLNRLTKETHKTILISTHELELALQTADRLFLMRPAEGVICGTPEDVVINGDLSTTFSGSTFEFDPYSGNFLLRPQQNRLITLLSKGEGFRTYWTERALGRIGYSLVPDSENVITVDERKGIWIYDRVGSSISVSTVAELLTLLNV